MIDGFLVAATVFSLSMATIMAVITWRVIRLDRRQTAALVARQPEEPTDSRNPPAWPPVRGDLRNRYQGIPRQALANSEADAAEPLWADLVIERTTAPAQAVAMVRREAAETPALFTPPVSASDGNRRFAIAIGVGALVVTSAIGSALVFSGRPAGLAFVSPAAAKVASPLELVSLDSARDGDRVTIRGLVRNPAAGTRVEHLQAVIFLFDRRGMYLGTSHAAVVQGVLPPGSESSFEVPLAAGLRVSRYRVSFRVATAPVPHIDRRPVPIPAPAGQRMAATEQPAFALGTPELPLAAKAPSASARPGQSPLTRAGTGRRATLAISPGAVQYPSTRLSCASGGPVQCPETGNQH
ncbi:MAG: hypothetical protein NT151_01580 [Acidobacteria bacterium]|nr:hypothetical protein [Acidobacteriota bacterium]